MVVTRYGCAVPCHRIEVVEASHPVPDAAGRAAAQRLLDSVKGLGPDDLLICLISGGASALLALPARGVTLADKQVVTRALLKSGANIAEINCVRKHLSAIKGGRLAAAAAPAGIVTLAISDVPGDDPAVIGSGLTVPDPSTFAEARAILAKYAIEPPPNVALRLAETTDETPKPGDPHFVRSKYVLIAAPQVALEAAAEEARDAGIAPVVLSDVSARMMIRIEQSKRRKDRYAMLSPRLLDLLRDWWLVGRSRGWLFPGRDPVQPRSPSAQRLRTPADPPHRPHSAPPCT